MPLSNDQIQEFLRIKEQSRRGIDAAQAQMAANQVSEEERLRVADDAKLRNLAAGLQGAADSFGSVQGKVTADNSGFENTMKSMNQADAGALNDKMKQYQLAQTNSDKFNDSYFQAVTGQANLEDKEATRQHQATQNALKLKEIEASKQIAASNKAAERESKKQDRNFDFETKIRKEYDDESKDFKEAHTAYATVEDLVANPGPGTDLSLIYAFMKSMDPRSVVRENEFGQAQAMGSFDEKMSAKINQWLGKGSLTPEQRQEIARAAKTSYTVKKQQQDALDRRYSSIAKDYNLDEGRVIYKRGPLRSEKPQEIAGGDTTSFSGGAAAELAKRREQNGKKLIGKELTLDQGQNFVNNRKGK